ncbi:MAG: phosphoribosylformylglycinamidine synthase subunit PurL [Sulfobacillus thermosulfidooxidans]|uniref:Phosphoribosylformylglycinamidine synthase subunit PurL n=1 Tax=Sulfobacillus thermosulfidooxidans TaxID=28034 RepID=A0A2T2X172_SULTH|nr:MAG: phosphoribosylformylglycinamidine synthase subunit PurL [Sulfobacillus thermosulfidooxidans]
MTYQDVGLTQEEYRVIQQQLGREPNELELGLFGVLWSEHCSYKSSKNLLSWLPHEGPAVVQGPGENAGIVALNDHVHVAFKVESHNHPSYVEPVQGAATGVGGILRDIVAMGARPIALADSLRFGTDDKAKWIQNGVVEGVGAYGNAIGIPTVTGEVAYGAVYDKNPLVNVMAIGLLSPEHQVSASGAKVGSYLVLLGQPTGRDGIHGASLLASQDFGDATEHMRPTVQVGDPFMGKMLMEATLSAIQTDKLDAVQDLGAAGLTSSVAELAYRSGVGAHIWLERVPCREEGMTPYEIMLSETQERMLLVVSPENWPVVEEIIQHWEVPYSIIGEVSADHELVISMNGEIVAAVPPQILAGSCPRRPAISKWAQTAREQAPQLTAFRPLTFEREWALEVLGSPNCRSRHRIYERYDSMILTNTVWGPTHDLAVLRVRGSQEGLAVAVSGPGRYAARDAYSGGLAAVSRVMGLLATQGAMALGLTDGINAGNPDKERVFLDLTHLIAGIADASQGFGVPVTGGNVSLHNETEGEPIWPTAIIGAVGRHLHPLHPTNDAPWKAGLDIIRLSAASDLNLGGSVFEMLHSELSAYPRPDISKLADMYELLIASNQESLEYGARLVGDGGLFVALSKSLLASSANLGMEITVSKDETTRELFSEVMGQMLLFTEPSTTEHWVSLFRHHNIAVDLIGHVTDSPTMVIRAGRSYVFDRTELDRTFRQGYGG